MEPNRGVKPGRRRWLIVAGLVLVVAAGVSWYVGADGTGGYTCVIVDSGDRAERDAAEDLCHRKAMDRTRRAPIANPGPIGYDGTADLMKDALSPLFRCQACREQPPERPATDADVTAARQALARAGLSDSVVRVARPEDPAPAGALVYALQMGDGCVVGYLEIGSLDDWYEVGGLLPNGRCLA